MCKKSYKKLYLNILEIGIKNVNSGLSYNKLVSELERKGYNLENDCIEKAVKHWFVDNFLHYDDNDKGTEQIVLDTIELENHRDCDCILKGQACLSLLDYQNAKRTLNTTKIALIIAVLALLFGIFSQWYLLPQFINNLKL